MGSEIVDVATFEEVDSGGGGHRGRSYRGGG